ncbi:MAG: O-antigen ligase family protein [Sandaracinaceae bacterium]
MFGLALVLAPELMGSMYGWGISLTTALVALGCALLAWSTRAAKRTVAIPVLVVVVAISIVWTVIQATPLPRALVEVLQPSAVAASDASATLRGVNPASWIPLSISPFGTRAEIVKGLAILCSLIGGWLLVAQRMRAELAKVIAISVVTMAIVALCHLGADAERAFGIFVLPHPGNTLVAPLVNQNHLAGFLALGAPLLAGLALDSEERGQRILYATLAAFTGATSLLSVSRGGAASLVVGLAVLGVLAMLRRRAKESERLSAPLALVGATTVAACGLGLYVASEGLFHELEHGDLSKLTLAGHAFGLALRHPWVGVGRGAFSAAFVANEGSEVRFTHAESFPSHWSAEWGLVMATALIAVLAASMYRAIRAARGWTQLGALAALAGLAVHELVDFATERLGVAVVAAALATVALAPSRRPHETGGRLVPAAWVAAGLAVLTTVALGLRIDATGVPELRERMETAMLAEDRAEFARVLEVATALHPSEPAFALLAGAEAARHDEPAGLRWLNRAMVTAPGWDAPHREAAAYLIRRGRITQGLLELRQAEERRSASPELLCRLLVARPEAAAELVRVARSDAVGLRWLDAVAACLPVGEAATEQIDDALTRHHVRSAVFRGARRELAEGHAERVLTMLDVAQLREQPEARVLLARAYVALDRHDEAIACLEDAGSMGQYADLGLRVRAEASARAGRAEAMRATMEERRLLAAGDAPALGRVWVDEAELEEQLGNDGRAIAAYERAHRLAQLPEALAGIARVAERIGQLGRAMRAYGELCSADPGGSACASHTRVRERLGESHPRYEQPLGTP